MKIFDFKLALAMLTFSAMSLFFQAPSQAQVNKKLLSAVIKSCQRDMNVDYFKRMGIIPSLGINAEPSSFIQKNCVADRYSHMTVIEQLPWLPYAGEILPGYSGSVAISVLGGGNADEDTILKCVTSQDFDGYGCSWINLWNLPNLYRQQGADWQMLGKKLPNICPKCVIAHDDASKVEINRGFINWFLSLDKSKRLDIVSFLSSGNRRQDLYNKRRYAEQAYEDALKKIEQDDKEQRRRNLLGQ